MLDIFSATGFLVHRPCGPRKSGIPESVEMPAPVSATMRRASSTHARTAEIGTVPIFLSLIRSRHLDLAAAARAAHRGQRALRHHDLRSGLAAQLLELLHGALDRLARELAELLRRFLERARARSEEHTSELQSLRHLVCRL